MASSTSAIIVPTKFAVVLTMRVAEHHREEEQHTERREGAHGTGERDDELAALAGVADVEAERAARSPRRSARTTKV